MPKNLILLVVIALSSTLTAQNYYIHAGRLIDTQNGKLVTNKTIVVSDGLITSVEDGFASPTESFQLIDLSSKTVLPSFIDMHVHIESETNPNQYLKEFTDNTADVAFESVGFAKTTLMAGFTTVRDLGGIGVNLALRDAINAGKIDGPRILTAGKSIGTTGGHADPTNGMKDELMGDPGPDEGVINGVDDAKKAVRQRYKNGADLIKITATGGVLSVAKNGQNPQFTLEEVQAICETARDYGMMVAAHAHGDEGMQRAIKGGVTTIEHGTLMSDETMDLMKQFKAYYVPTITAGKFVADNAKIKGYYPEVIVPKALEIGPKIQGTFAKAYKKGVAIAFGTDAGVFPHGQNAKEFGYMVEAGMSAMEAIQSATTTNAKVLGLSNKIGVLAKGFVADIVAVNDNPLDNIHTLENVIFVMKDGKVYKGN
ncbi:MAG: amidohydrolase family protein [Bacteroidetes bacterium]|nr:amidohydrolase family protein [Bacteroidota bacterium]MDA0879709.1 amidohydrolase family protein [Bacteroidota bacterium]MDA1115316.1 amidohydrolase family protein [Bacteroidota bacterium]